MDSLYCEGKGVYVCVSCHPEVACIHKRKLKPLSPPPSPPSPRFLLPVIVPNKRGGFCFHWGPGYYGVDLKARKPATSFPVAHVVPAPRPSPTGRRYARKEELAAKKRKAAEMRLDGPSESIGQPIDPRK
jgi:hypothetical protein